MPAEPQRDTIHLTQHLLIDGLRTLRAQLPEGVATDDTRAVLDRAIERLTPMEGLSLASTPARLYGLTHAMRTLLDDIIPYVDATTMDLTEVPAALREAEAKLLAQRDAAS